MRRNFAVGPERRTGRGNAGSLARLLLVAVLALGFWGAALWVADLLLKARASGF